MKTNGSQGWASPYVSVEAIDAGVEIPEVERIEAGAQQMSWGLGRAQMPLSDAIGLQESVYFRAKWLWW